MRNFDAFDKYLSLDFSEDYWSDEGIEQTLNLMRHLSSDEKTILKKVWPLRSEEWQARCAQVLPYGEPQLGLEILLGMSAQNSDNVRVSALLSLRRLDLTRLSSEQKDFVESIARDLLLNAGKIVAAGLRDLLGLLEKSKSRKA